jgi:hypothetical protein
MNTKTIIAGIVTGIVGFLLGWLIWGLLLMDYNAKHMLQYPGLLKNPPDYLYIIIGSLSNGLLLAYIFKLSKIETAAKGAVAGLIISVLIAASVNAYFFASYNLIGRLSMLIDVISNAVYGAVLGAFLGWWLGQKPKAA